MSGVSTMAWAASSRLKVRGADERQEPASHVRSLEEPPKRENGMLRRLARRLSWSRLEPVSASNRNPTASQGTGGRTLLSHAKSTSALPANKKKVHCAPSHDDIPAAHVKEAEASPARDKDLDRVVFAAQLAKTYNLDHFETRRIVKEWDKFQSFSKKDQNRKRFVDFLQNVFDVSCVDESTAKSAYDATLRDNHFSLDDFMAWYMRNMFTRGVKAMNMRHSKVEREFVDDTIQKKLEVDAHTICQIRLKFDKYDVDRSGAIDFDEFKAILTDLMRTNTDDFSSSRHKNFWDEAAEGSDELSFYQFAKWYTKYFYRPDSKTPVDAMYETYNPIRMRSKQYEAGGQTSSSH